MPDSDTDILHDDHNKPKIFTLAGYNSQPEVKADIINKIKSLGGTVLDTACWDSQVTNTQNSL